MIASGGTKIKLIAVSGAGMQLCTPCGGCRQRIREFASLKTDILICTGSQFKKRFNLEMLLPDSFGPDNLV
jgi:cytidine deaminase